MPYQELDVEPVFIGHTQSCSRRCSDRTRWCRCRGATLLAYTIGISLLCSLLFSALIGLSAFTAIERSFVLFIVSVVFFAETVAFGKYFVDTVRLKRNKLSWHAARCWVPFADFAVVTLASLIASTLLPCGVLADLYNQFYLLDYSAKQLTVTIILGTVLKLISAVALTTAHVRSLRSFQANAVSEMDPDNFPYTRSVAPPTAPP